jgi:putative addiction module component (TIGR02574 family)
MSITKEDIDAMSYEEKRKLLEMLWESFENNDDENYVDDIPDETEEELQILQERLEEYKKDPAKAIPWDEAYKQLKKKYDQ